MTPECVPLPPAPGDECRIGSLGTFASPSVESAFRQHHLRDDHALLGIIVLLGMIRVLLAIVVGPPAPEEVLAGRILFVPVSVGVLVAIRRAATPTRVD